MARYFFNVRHKSGPEGVADDPDGDEITDAGSVREHALTVVRDLIARTRLDGIANWFDCAFEITDERGHAVMTVPFKDTVPEEDEPEPARRWHCCTPTSPSRGKGLHDGYTDRRR